jgi:hypothetical protein
MLDMGRVRVDITMSAGLNAQAGVIDVLAVA